MITKLKIADYITLLNLFAGLFAIYFAFNDEIMIASVLILAGALIDKIDGLVARNLNQETDFGVQLDSFADAISFGVAPAAIIVNNYNVLWLSITSLLLPLAGILRLARFNITKNLFKKHFTGVPITLNGLIFPILMLLNLNASIICIIIVILSYLMISNIKIKKVF